MAYQNACVTGHVSVVLLFLDSPDGAAGVVTPNVMKFGVDIILAQKSSDH